ncbi:PREDICTED: protein transport protein Sec31A-like [Acropora digitifera]|uniref:protein transport protein Sec31A-like n=1 Tax=Acropora digitifera TaxID=70779 RepID=UPI00077A7356|nr:PREDICTED: protein transport protein Sec31A-like [Acropora digitifera]
MKVKEVNRTANIAWSPAPQYPIYLAAGTAAQQLDATFREEAKRMENQTYLNLLKRKLHHTFILTFYFLPGPVQALDINPFKTSLLASGASDSEIFIWDLTNPSSPLTPGSKTLPPDNISCVAWNRQVQHILASASPCGRCVVWDLRKNEPIIKVSDQSAMMWDLRFATSPMKVLEGHQRGILSIAWCPQDPDLLMSCAKDNRILCWNPNTQDAGGEITYELPTTSQWSFDVAWCPRNPAMICSSSFDGHVSVFSLMGGGASSQDFNQQKVMSAFDADDPFSTQIRQAQQQQQQQQNSAPTSSPLKKPPKWLRRPCGASFSFGGKLISFGQTKDSPIAQVNISQVTTEQELVNRSYELEGALASGSFIQYCNSKVENSTQDLERTLWSFLKINFEREPRRHFLTLLGYDPMELSKKVASSYTSSSSSRNEGGVDAEELVQKMQLLSAGEATNKLGQSVFSSGASTPSVTGSKTPLSEAGSLSEGAAAFDVIAAGGPLSVDTGDLGVGEPVKQPSPFQIPTDDDTDGLISQALLTGNFEAAVDVCLYADRMADAFLLAIAGGPDLLARIQTRYFEKSKSHVARLMSVVVNRDWRDIVESCVLENWREALAALVTYAKAEEFTALCDLLGQRLEQEGDEHCANSMVCYICAGNVEKFVSCWTKNMPAEPSPLALQELIEKVMILKKAVERERRLFVDSGSPILAEKLSKYAEILAAQGCLETAMGYLMTVNDEGSLGVLKDRLFNAQFPGHISAASARPPFPFQRIDVQAEPIAQTQTQSQNQPQFQQPPLQQQQSGYGVPSQQQLPQQHRQLAQQSQQYYQPQQQHVIHFMQELPAPILKGPIPSEHLTLQETFNGLAERCKNTANNPHTKRKLDDVSKRLEALYDKLREQKMSNPILEGLHEIAQACQDRDYPRGLMAHTRLISSGSFSEISTFMPGLKSLMQIATQLRV